MEWSADIPPNHGRHKQTPRSKLAKTRDDLDNWQTQPSQEIDLWNECGGSCSSKGNKINRKKKKSCTWYLTEEGVGVFAEGGRHGGVDAGLAVAGGQLGSRVVATLVVVVLDIQVDQLGEIDAQRAAGIVDVLAVERLDRGGEEGRRKRKKKNKTDKL